MLFNLNWILDRILDGAAIWIQKGSFGFEWVTKDTGKDSSLDIGYNFIISYFGNFLTYSDGG